MGKLDTVASFVGLPTNPAPDHLVIMNGYVIADHVGPSVVRDMLVQKPKIRGLAGVGKCATPERHSALDAMALGEDAAATLGVDLGRVRALVVLGAAGIVIPAFARFRISPVIGFILVGLLVGRIGRTGPVLWSMPHGVATTLSALGMSLFLAYAGSNAGSALADALRGPTGIQLLLVGVVVTSVTAAVLVLGSRLLAGVYGPRLGGILAGSQTQPAVLAYANESTHDDPRVNLGYALVYPAAMIVKVVVGPLLGRF